MNINYGLFETELGLLLVAGTAKGLCLVAFLDSEMELDQVIGERYANDEVCRDEAYVKEWADAIQSYLDSGKSLPDFSLDVNGTSFQRQVWQALQAIPVGATQTYQQIAESIGKPGACRAVGQACGNNPVAIVIPCHRVIRSDGHLGGFRWGLQRKSTLLKCEKERAAKSAKSNPASLV